MWPNQAPERFNGLYNNNKSGVIEAKSAFCRWALSTCNTLLSHLWKRDFLWFVSGDDSI
jgi:hypothetical protein